MSLIVWQPFFIVKTEQRRQSYAMMRFQGYVSWAADNPKDPTLPRKLRTSSDVDRFGDFSFDTEGTYPDNLTVSLLDLTSQELSINIGFPLRAIPHRYTICICNNAYMRESIVCVKYRPSSFNTSPLACSSLWHPRKPQLITLLQCGEFTVLRTSRLLTCHL